MRCSLSAAPGTPEAWQSWNLNGLKTDNTTMQWPTVYKSATAINSLNIGVSVIIIINYIWISTNILGSSTPSWPMLCLVPGGDFSSSLYVEASVSEPHVSEMATQDLHMHPRG